MIFYSNLVNHRKVYLKQNKEMACKIEEMKIKNLYFLLKVFVLTGGELAL